MNVAEDLMALLHLSTFIICCMCVVRVTVAALVDRTWNAFCDGDESEEAVIDLLCTACTFVLISRAPFQYKLASVFDLYDFEDKGAISQDESVSAVYSHILSGGRCAFFGLCGAATPKKCAVGLGLVSVPV